ncbi:MULTISPECIES: non-canonical purine NTP diphosphatase [Capnocytophaga]|uniref:dITP/XTP pyrophosphatase n=1 Tax=Capnocytophaga canis TaxID=1848903 RepID=A0A3A1YH94_9FLAO|nr:MULTISPECIES: non-canonical purine NTP diphosphatase [Capnocytophaga]ATA74311.1 non-canonical purine NTP pyrophosphatase [Capnocytophaga sp. H2931]RIY37613.1 non-canonical purine NTP pyrophosphatase [Capnocytophaga canis]
MLKIVFATNNLNKLNEIQALMPDSIQVLSLKDINFDDDIEETESTIEGNAVLKAQYIKKHYGYDVFADDSGLEVVTLDNQPGVFSARYAGNHRSDTDNIALLLKNMQGQTNRKARFKTVIALCIGTEVHTFIGIAEGEITQIAKGTNGFGYDPIFKPEGYDQTFAELSASEKNGISHRGKAVKQLVEFLSFGNKKS